ncbi:MAG: sulfatase-like hydrolase/transferase [Verrucomicrobia bacterium]|nr:sulfatase-like hydrolase/transferase [Verrucomicrobiota bacterium]
MKPLLFLASLCVFCGQASAAKPNILHINADDHRADGLHALGNDVLKTPHLDTLVGRGMVFTRCYTQGSRVGAVCLPSRTMMLTGRALFRIPGRGDKGAGPMALPTAIKAAGYETWHAGKGGNEYKAGLEAFDTNLIMDHRGDERARSSQEHADAAVKFLRERAKERPFYIYLAPPVPHDPRICPKQFMDMYDPARIPLSPAFLPVHPWDNGDMAVRDEHLAPWPRTAEDTRRQLADYYACVTGLDHHIGRIFAALKETGQFDNTVIVFTGDNGLSLGEHGLFGKQNLYEFGGMHVPLVLAGPGVPRGRSNALAYLMDLFPTFCDFAGARPPAGLDGKSLRPIIEGKTAKVRDALYTAYQHCQRAVRDDRWKLIRYPLVDKTQLFDLAADPRELNNLADKPGHAAKVKEMLALLEKEMRANDDPTPLTVANPRSPDWTPPAAGKKEGRAPGTSSAADKPNVLLVCVDDLKPLLGCYGAPVVKSPNIDRLAARGVLFERAFCNQAVCSPSRNALLTGLRSQTLGIYDLATHFRKSVPDAVTVGQYFKKHGWRTEAMGKIFHVGHGNHEDPASWSVEHWRPASVQGGGYALKENRPKEMTREEARFSNSKVDPSKLPRGAATECADVPDTAYGDGMIADEAITRLRAAKDKPGEPFFIAVGFLKPHLPFVAPKKYWDLYLCASFEPPNLQKRPIGAPEFAPTTWGELRQYSDIPEVGPLTTEQQRQLIHGYHAATSYMDAQLGRVLDALDRNGFAKNTIIVLWGDHGWHLGDHGMWCKHTNYEQAARIPLIVVAPGVAKAGAKTGALAESVDIYPTLCELAGLPAPRGLDGASFAAALKNPAAMTKEAVFHVYPRNQLMGRAVRTARYRLVEWKKIGEPADTAVMELYDYENDSDETKNLAADKPGVVAQLRAILAKQPEAKPQVRAAAGKDEKKAAAKPKQDRAAMFAKRDKDGDGKLTREEFLDKQPDPDEAPKRFIQFDANKDGVLSREEFVTGGKNK